MITVYGMRQSGNCWKVAQILTLTGRPFRWVELDSNRGETRTPEFLARNPAGQVPTVELDDGAIITESGAILVHFAEGTPWLPPVGIARTRVFEWLFFEQNSHEPFIAVARNIVYLMQEKEDHRARLELCWRRGKAALDFMEATLSRRDWLTEDGPTIADLALFAYTQVAEQGEFDLAPLPGVRAWRDRVRQIRGLTPLAG